MFEDRILVFDGAIGTELYDRGFYINRPFEELNISAPGNVKQMHLDYLQAGADVITTNTYSITKPLLKKFDIEDKQSLLLSAGLEVANQARDESGKSQAKIALSLGPLGVLVEPLGPTSFEEVEEEYASLAHMALESGHRFDCYLLETFTIIEELKHAILGLRKIDPTTPIVACYSTRSSKKKKLSDFCRVIGQMDEVQALGLNCSEGPSDLLTQCEFVTPLINKPLLLQPNAGIPRHLNGRYHYMVSPDYLAKYTKRFVQAGARAIGSCCGTGPQHTQAISGAVAMVAAQDSAVQQVRGEGGTFFALESERPRPSLEERSKSKMARALVESKDPIISIELTPPKAANMDSFLEKIDLLISHGIQFANVPDGPRASTRVNSLHLASAVKKARGEALSLIPHFTTRDRNLIALQADLLGASINEVHELLLVTGDPPKVGNNKEATAIYDIDSIGLTHMVNCLNKGLSPKGDDLGDCTQFAVGVASNPTSINLELELKRFQYKLEMGADYTVTQPIFEADCFKRWLDKIENAQFPHLVGIWPLVSLRNAEFMANEVPGIHVPTWVLDEMEKSKDDKEDSIKRGVEIAQKVMDELKSICRGFVVSAPLGKTQVALDALAPLLQSKDKS